MYLTAGINHTTRKANHIWRQTCQWIRTAGQGQFDWLFDLWKHYWRNGLADQETKVSNRHLWNSSPGKYQVNMLAVVCCSLLSVVGPFIDLLSLVCCRCCLSVGRTWSEQWSSSRAASHPWSTDSGTCVPTELPPPSWWSSLPTRSDPGVTMWPLLGSNMIICIHLEFGEGVDWCWSDFISFRVGQKKRSSYSWRTPTCWIPMTLMFSL